MNAEQGNTDYTKLSDVALLDLLRDDASLWAAAFCQIARKHGHEIDEGWMIGWFANAIENAWEIRMRRSLPETVPLATKALNHQ